jgi:hypothetical protein
MFPIFRLPEDFKLELVIPWHSLAFNIKKPLSGDGLFFGFYPLVNVNKKLWKDPPVFMGKSTINGHFQ